MRRRRPIELFSISFLDLLSGALGAVIILYVAIPKNRPVPQPKDDKIEKILLADLSTKNLRIAELEAELAESKRAVQRAEVTEAKGESGGKNLDVGFKFKGKEILFIIDTSFSMTEEDRMGQVKAGLKMLITSLTSEYKIEVIQYPNAVRAPFRTLWGVPRENSALNQQEVFEFIRNLQPSGGTPTRDVLLFTLENYEKLSDIVLLSDGAPTLHNSNTKDDIGDILRVVREMNPRKVQINCIGVGSEFTSDKESDRYRFLSQLSTDSGGFFVGF